MPFSARRIAQLLSNLTNVATFLKSATFTAGMKSIIFNIFLKNFLRNFQNKNVFFKKKEQADLLSKQKLG